MCTGDAGQARTAARVQARLAGGEWVGGHGEQAIERLKSAYAALADDEPDPDLAVVVSQLGRILALEGRYEEAYPLVEGALELAEHLELLEVYSQALSSKAVILIYSDRLNEAGGLLRQARAVALEHGLTAAAQRAYDNLGVVLESQDRFAESVVLCEQQLELASRVGVRFWELASLTGALSALFPLGRWEDALAKAEEARGAEELAPSEAWASSLLTMSSVHVRRGELGEARLLLDSMRWAGRSEDRQARAEYTLASAEDRPAEALAAAEEFLVTRAVLGIGLTHSKVKTALVRAVEAALDLGDWGRADQLLGMVRAARPGQVTPWLGARVARLSARVSAAAGEHEAVESGFEAAEAGFRDLGTLFDLAVTLTEQAELLVARGRQDRAGPLRAQARQIFERLQARPWLERLGPLAGEESVPA